VVIVIGAGRMPRLARRDRDAGRLAAAWRAKE